MAANTSGPTTAKVRCSPAAPPTAGGRCTSTALFDRLTARTEPDGARYEFGHDIELRLRQVTDPRGLTPGRTPTIQAAGSSRDRLRRQYAAVRLRRGRSTDGPYQRCRPDGALCLRRRRSARPQDVGGAVTAYEHDVFDELTRAVGPDSTMTRLRDRSPAVGDRQRSHDDSRLRRTGSCRTPCDAHRRGQRAELRSDGLYVPAHGVRTHTDLPQLRHRSASAREWRSPPKSHG